MKRLFLPALCLMLASLSLLAVNTDAQVATPAPQSSLPAARADLAAMALDSSTIPDTFLLTTELYMPGNRLEELYTGELITQTEIDNIRLLWFYESHYQNLDGTQRIRSYVEEYPDVDSAISGFNLLEDENRLNAINATSNDEPWTGNGESPSEVSFSSIPQGNSAPDMQSLDITFRSGNLIAGAAVETTDGSTPDRALAEQLANDLAARIESVQAGTPLPGIAPDLATMILPFDPAWLPGQEGYISAREAYGPNGGAPVAADFQGGYLRSAGAGTPLPVLSIHIEQFSDEGAPLSTLSQPEIFQPTFTAFEEMPIDPIPGASVAIGYRYANPLAGSTVIDSFRIVMVVDAMLVTIDVQGSRNDELARDLATHLARAQVVCIKSSAPCSQPAFQADLLIPAGPATPTVQTI